MIKVWINYVDQETINKWYSMCITEDNRFLEGDLVAVGDVHGSIDLLFEMVNVVRNTGVRLLFLGDLIDRAKKTGDDVRVLSSVRRLIEEPKVAGLSWVGCLRGNHEDMFLRAVDGEPESWIINGGDWESFDQLRSHAKWLRNLPLTHQEGDTLFVHAGLRPNVPLEKQTEGDKIWIREPFLSAENLNVDGVKTVVHGHSPNFCGFPVVKPNRICLDSGAYFTGRLTGYNMRSGEVFQVQSG